MIGCIYGLFSEDGKCHYVGVTTKPKARAYKHKRALPTFIFKVIRPISSASFYRRNEIERQIITAYWKRGEAEINKHRPKKPPATDAWIAGVKARVLNTYGVQL